MISSHAKPKKPLKKSDSHLPKEFSQVVKRLLNTPPDPRKAKDKSEQKKPAK